MTITEGVTKWVRAGGFIQVVFAMFHVYLATVIGAMEGIPAEAKILLQMLNFGGILMIVLFAWASLTRCREMVTTGLGRLLLWFIFLVYATRAVEEVLFFGLDLAPIILAACVGVSLFYLVILIRLNKNSATTSTGM